jgi:hypothetical protein
MERCVVSAWAGVEDVLELFSMLIKSFFFSAPAEVSKSGFGGLELGGDALGPGGPFVRRGRRSEVERGEGLKRSWVFFKVGAWVRVRLRERQRMSEVLLLLVDQFMLLGKPGG